LRRWLAAAQHILGDTAFAEVDAELEQLAVNARCTPRGILPTHLADQVSSFAGNREPSALSPPNLPGPKQAEAHAMPSHNRLRLDDGQRGAPIAPETGQRNPEEAIRGSQFGAFLQRALKHTDSMAQSRVFQLEVNSGTDERTQDDEKCDQKSRHRMKGM